MCITNIFIHYHTPSCVNKVIDDANQWLWASMWCTTCNTPIVTCLSHNLLCFILFVGSSRQPRLTSAVNKRVGTTSVSASFLRLECPLGVVVGMGAFQGITFYIQIWNMLSVHVFWIFMICVRWWENFQQMVGKTTIIFSEHLPVSKLWQNRTCVYLIRLNGNRKSTVVLHKSTYSWKNAHPLL